MLDGQGRYPEAEAEYRRAVAIWEQAFGPDHPAPAMALIDFGNSLISQRRYAEAEQELRLALEMTARMLGPDNLLARIRWEDPDQRTRARTLARTARDDFTRAGPTADQARADVEQWLRQHG